MLTTEQVIRAYWNAFNAHDVEALLSLMTNDVTIRFPTSSLVGGKEKIRSALSMIFSLVVPDIVQDVRSIILGPNCAACEVIERGTVRFALACNDPQPLTERPYVRQVAAFFTTARCGGIRGLHLYWDTMSFREQIDLDIPAALQAQVTSVAEWLSCHGPLPTRSTAQSPLDPLQRGESSTATLASLYGWNLEPRARHTRSSSQARPPSSAEAGC